MVAGDNGDERRHTASQQAEEPAKLSPAIADAVEMLRAAFSAQKVPVLYWNAHYVAVPLEVRVPKSYKARGAGELQPPSR
jgi:hypothetical protein